MKTTKGNFFNVRRIESRCFNSFTTFTRCFNRLPPVGLSLAKNILAKINLDSRIF